jgi:hypothetical protein
MNPFSVGSPIDDIVITRKTAAKTGITFDRPAVLRDLARVPALVDDADDQEERAGRDAVIELLTMLPVMPDRVNANMPSITHRHVADRRIGDEAASSPSARARPARRRRCR